MDFTESIVHVIVDKVGKADFSLTVQVDRVDADEDEIITGDRYAFLRDAYLQRREFLVSDGQMEDDFLEDDW